MDQKLLQDIVAGVRDCVRSTIESRDKLDQFAAETKELYTRRDTMRKLAKSTGTPAFARQVELHDLALSQHGLVELKCTACKATTRGNCTCGSPYVPGEQTRAETTALFRASQLIAAHPEWSNRKVAKELGVGETTVRRAREHGAPDGAPDRIGRDGKTYSGTKNGKALALPSPDDDLIQDPCDGCETQEQFWQTSLSNVAGDAIAMRAYWTRMFGDWSAFEAPSSLVILAKQAAQEWMTLAKLLERRRTR